MSKNERAEARKIRTKDHWASPAWSPSWSFEDGFAGVGREAGIDLIDFLFGEVLKSALFSHNSEREKGEIR